MIALCKYPTKIAELISSNKNSFGIHEVKFIKSGKPIRVVLDEFFSCIYDNPSFAKGPDMKVCLIEKAWAKLHTSYHKIESGFPDEAFADLTGAPSY